MAKKDKQRIILGSGKLYAMEFTGEVPKKEEICVNDNLLSYIQGGATLEYKATFYTAKDDLGYAEKTIITEEEATLKSGLMVFNVNNLKILCATGRVIDSEDGKYRTLKIGGIENADGKKYVICFHHTDKTDGDIWVIIVGVNQSGFSIAFAKDKETVVDAEFKALVQDDEGTLIQYIEEIKGAAEPVSAANAENATPVAPAENATEKKTNK